LAGGAALAVISVAVIGYMARDFWFSFDDWDFLTTREIGSGDDLLRPHGPHWKTWVVVTFRGVYGLVGPDYWPWYFLPRLIGHAAMAFVIWRVVLRRGADPVLAGGAFAVLLVLGVSFYQGPETVGMYIVFSAVAGVALLVHEQASPTVRQQVAVFALLLAALMSNGWGLALLGSTGLVVLATGRVRQWWAPLAGAAAVYVGWYALYRDQLPDRSQLTPAALIDSIAPMFVILRTTIQNTLGLPSPLAVLAVVALLGALLGLAVSGRLDRFDAIVLMSLGVTLGLLSLQRVVPFQEGASRLLKQAATEPRFGYGVFVLLLLALLPHVPVRQTRIARIAIGAGAVTLVAFNLVSLSERMNRREDVTRDARAAVETAGALIAAGEPYLPAGRFPGVRRAGPFALVFLSTDGVDRLVADGWDPNPSTDPHVRWAVRGALRMQPDRGFRAPGLPDRRFQAPADATIPVTRLNLSDGCFELTAAPARSFAVNGPGAITVEGPPDSLVLMTWQDGFGLGTAWVGPGALELVEPAGSAMVTADLRQGGPVLICGLEGQ
jgi:hypothetical protein